MGRLMGVKYKLLTKQVSFKMTSESGKGRRKLTSRGSLS